MHGEDIRRIDRFLVRRYVTFFGTSRTDLQAETESKIMATRPEALQTKYHSTTILRSEQDSKYRLRQQCDETVEHF